MTRSILITGCSSGIGADAARTLHTQGWQVFATVRRPQDGADLRAAGITTLLLDYAQPETIKPALEEVLRHTGGTLDALFNNGAHAIPGAVEDLPTEALRAIFEANLFGWHELTRAVLPIMRTQGHGRIVQCSSVLGYVAAPWRGAYVATKFALEGLTDTLRLEMEDTPIDVILIEPGPIGTQFRANAIPHFERWIDWKSSRRAAQYQDSLLKRLYEQGPPDRFQLPPAAVTHKLLRALTAKRPKARYRVTTPAYLGELIRRALPSRLRDRLLRRS